MSTPPYLTPTQILLVNKSTVLSTNDVRLINIAMSTALADFCYAWGIQPAMTYFPINALTLPVMNPAAKTHTLTISDLTDVPGAYGYHSDVSGVAIAKVFAKSILNGGGGILHSNTSSLSVAQVISHEIFEMLANTICNTWWVTPSGASLYAGEVCDPVQGNTFSVTVEGKQVSLSDYILPAWSLPGSKSGPYNKANTLTAPFTVARNGYCIRVNMKSATVSYVFGAEVPPSVQETQVTDLRNDVRFAGLAIGN